MQFMTAGKWPLLYLKWHRTKQTNKPVECFVAGGTDVRFHGCVGEAVSGQVAGLSERPRADLALERLVSRVNSLEQTWVTYGNNVLNK